MTTKTETAGQSTLDCKVLSSALQEALDGLTRLAADLFDAPCAVISLGDAGHRNIASHHGLDATRAHQLSELCEQAIATRVGSTLAVEDAADNPGFRSHRLVTGEPKIRFVASTLLTGTDGSHLGALCVVDGKPRRTPGSQTAHRLETLARLVVSQLEAHRASLVATDSQRLLKLANDVAGVGYWRWDIPNQTLTWSDQIFVMYGLPLDIQPSLKQAISSAHPDDQIRAHKRHLEAMRSGQGWNSGLVRIFRPDGEMRYVEGRGLCERDATGAVTTIFGTMVDVTERMRAELAAEEAQAERNAQVELFETAFHYAAVGEALVGLDGRFLKVNGAFCDIIDYPQERMLDLDFQTITHPDDLDADLHLLAQLLAGEIPSYQMDKRYIRSDGVVVWVHLSASMVVDADGKPQHFIAQVQDLTARKAMEAELLQARAEAEAAAAVKSEFLANMSHELRTPLTSILGFIGLTAEQPDLSDLTRNYVERVGDASRALLCTVNDILDFSKLEAGQVNFHPEPTSVAKLIGATLDLFMPQAGAKDLSLSVEGDGDHGDLVVRVDPDRVRQILLNLVGNAVKFTAMGGVTLRTHYDRERERLRVDVADTGPGIKADRLDGLFKRFSQIDGSLTRAHGGTGLGLAICKGLVEAMHGEIGMDTRLGEGSRFWFEIPAPPAIARTAPAEGPKIDWPTFDGVRVLVVDDHATNRELARLYLAGAGAEVSEAGDGEEAVSLAAAWPYDVILMDLRMPRLDGSGALRQIRETPGPNDATPILAFTADADAQMVTRLTAMGFQDVVCKPVEPASLIAAVARATAFEANEQQGWDQAHAR